MKRDLEEAERERERLQLRIEPLEKQNTRLRRQLDAARLTPGSRQAAPFAKALTPRLKGTRPDEPAPSTASRLAELQANPGRCPPRRTAAAKLSGLPWTSRARRRVASQLQEELPVPRVVASPSFETRSAPVRTGADGCTLAIGCHRLTNTRAQEPSATRVNRSSRPMSLSTENFGLKELAIVAKQNKRVFEYLVQFVTSSGAPSRSRLRARRGSR